MLSNWSCYLYSSGISGHLLRRNSCISVWHIWEHYLCCSCIFFVFPYFIFGSIRSVGIPGTQWFGWSVHPIACQRCHCLQMIKRLVGENIYCLFFLYIFVPIQNIFHPIQNVFVRTSNTGHILLVAGAVQLLSCSPIKHLYIYCTHSTIACGCVASIPILFFCKKCIYWSDIEQFPNHIWRKLLYKRNQRHASL